MNKELENKLKELFGKERTKIKWNKQGDILDIYLEFDISKQNFEALISTIEQYYEIDNYILFAEWKELLRIIFQLKVK